MSNVTLKREESITPDEKLRPEPQPLKRGFLGLTHYPKLRDLISISKTLWVGDVNEDFYYQVEINLFCEMFVMHLFIVRPSALRGHFNFFWSEEA